MEVGIHRSIAKEMLVKHVPAMVKAAAFGYSKSDMERPGTAPK
jgi:hypothetical protein